MTQETKLRAGRLHSTNPQDAAWRARQAQVDADIEGLARDSEADRLIAQMCHDGIPEQEQVERLKAYFLARRDREQPLQ